MKSTLTLSLAFAFLIATILACGPTGDVIQVTTVETEQEPLEDLGEQTLSQLEQIRAAEEDDPENRTLKKVIEQTPNYTTQEYLRRYPGANDPKARNYTIGGYDLLDIVVYEEEDLSREGVPVSADGYITFPLIGRIEVEGKTTSEVEELIANRLAQEQYLLNAHVSVTVAEYKSKQFIVLGSVKEPGSYPMQARERVLDAISRAGGVDFEQGGKHGMIIRTDNPASSLERKIVIQIDLGGLLKGGDQLSNLLLVDQDVLYIPKAENFYIIGQVKEPGSYPYLEKEITLVEAISLAGGFTDIAGRNRTRIIRVEGGVEKIIQVHVDAITDSGMKAKDVVILPGDVIVVPESYF